MSVNPKLTKFAEPKRRVYFPSTQTFGIILKEGGILGIPDSCLVEDESGKRTAYFGKNKMKDIVFIDTYMSILYSKLSTNIS